MIDKDAIARDILDIRDKGKTMTEADCCYTIMLHIQDHFQDLQGKLYDEIVKDLKERGIMNGK